jgi:hypothetical protein
MGSSEQSEKDLKRFRVALWFGIVTNSDVVLDYYHQKILERNPKLYHKNEVANGNLRQASTKEPIAIVDPNEGNNWISLYKSDITTEDATLIINNLLPEWWAQFKKKNNEYGTHDDDLGMRGQYADIHRKMKKLRNALWDGKPLTHEQPREVILDLIGHLFLTLAKGDRDGWDKEIH